MRLFGFLFPGYSYADLLKVVEWVEPVVKVCERLRSLGDPIVIVEGVRADDLHNIQTHPEQDFEEIMVRHLCTLLSYVEDPLLAKNLHSEIGAVKSN